ncbi:ABC-type antimicrobial peptide transport system, ATPase component [Caldisphaera lagunensis DSM 15908]|uniref:ABC-type antimicrobial peptide transport system, ATPase component n=1 Tax=Caldisphaera lagunensis (strain DSM 15908 / JCM 11604 / ANMR 0165 / IC-154) TaxID=1056495 RepID=L0A9U9_CALLD|nr:ATP-binding cassette domain-containing protein [Caldisphaera lagunensis]AFZ70668.1 ABC-type antimicrobial peptide transport system, ATPase component [Caldisphaera lagunensis DSM 15908]
MIKLIEIKVSKNKKEIIKRANLTLNKGEIVEIYGKNGSGKTTLLKVLSLIQKVDEGNVIYFNKNITNYKESNLSKIRLNYIGYVEQQYRLIPGLNVLESISLPLLLKGINKKEAEKISIELINEMNLKGKEGEVVDNLSGGEKQRVSIASAIAKDPKVLILDEPFSNQDDIGEEIIIKKLKELKIKEKIIVFSSPYMIEGIADKIYIMKEGILMEKD